MPDWRPPDGSPVSSKREHGKELFFAAQLFLFLALFPIFWHLIITILIHYNIMRKMYVGHVVFSPDGEYQHLPPVPSLHNVTTETSNFTPVDDSLDIKDEENNKFQQEMLNSYLIEKRKILSKSEALIKDNLLTASTPNKNDLESVAGSQGGQTLVRRPKVNDMVEHEMELIQFEENNLSNQMTILEHKIREAETEGQESERLLTAWFELISKKNIIFHRRLLIEIVQDEDDLEKRCGILQAELRRPELDPEAEKFLLEELIRLVDLRDNLVSVKIDEEQLLCREESIGKEVQFRQINKYSKCQIQ